MLTCAVHKSNSFHLSGNYVENWLLYRSIRRRELVGSRGRAPMNIFKPLWVVPSSNGDWIGYQERREVYHNIRLTFMPFEMISCFLYSVMGRCSRRLLPVLTISSWTQLLQLWANTSTFAFFLFVCMHVWWCISRCVCVCMEAMGGCLMSFSITFCYSLETQPLTKPTACYFFSEAGSQQTLVILLSPHLTVLGLKVSEHPHLAFCGGAGIHTRVLMFVQ